MVILLKVRYVKHAHLLQLVSVASVLREHLRGAGFVLNNVATCTVSLNNVAAAQCCHSEHKWPGMHHVVSFGQPEEAVVVGRFVGPNHHQPQLIEF